MKKPKLTPLESRASRALAHLAAPGGEIYFTVEWRKSRTWGSIAVIEADGGKAAEASGCGYDKLSACVVDFLYLMPDPAAAQAIAGASGAGIGTIKRRLAETGWNFEEVAATSGTDTFRLSRTAPEPPAPLAALRHHVTGAIERGEAIAITEKRA